MSFTVNIKKTLEFFIAIARHHGEDISPESIMHLHAVDSEKASVEGVVAILKKTNRDLAFQPDNSYLKVTFELGVLGLWLLVLLLVSTVLLVGALTFIPALALGPIVEQLQMLR